jgi:hypothetical protein
MGRDRSSSRGEQASCLGAFRDLRTRAAAQDQSRAPLRLATPIARFRRPDGGAHGRADLARGRHEPAPLCVRVRHASPWRSIASYELATAAFARAPFPHTEHVASPIAECRNQQRAKVRTPARPLSVATNSDPYDRISRYWHAQEVSHDGRGRVPEGQRALVDLRPGLDSEGLGPCRCLMSSTRSQGARWTTPARFCA